MVLFYPCSENWNKGEFKDNEVICFKEEILRPESIQPMVWLHVCELPWGDRKQNICLEVSKLHNLSIRKLSWAMWVLKPRPVLKQKLWLHRNKKINVLRVRSSFLKSQLAERHTDKKSPSCKWSWRLSPLLKCDCLRDLFLRSEHTEGNVTKDDV